ncbi:MAG: hypothetical protein GY950_23300, partial [bacterium]|nr:hypothetical protein [bacterium]
MTASEKDLPCKLRPLSFSFSFPFLFLRIKAKALFPQLFTAVTIASWTLVNAGTVFGILHYLDILRVDVDTERVGLDIKEHGGSATRSSCKTDVAGPGSRPARIVTRSPAAR